jgi:hypothetical protein
MTFSSDDQMHRAGVGIEIINGRSMSDFAFLPLRWDQDWMNLNLAPPLPAALALGPVQHRL